MTDIHVQETSSTSQTIPPRIKPSPNSSKLASQFFYSPSDDGTDENLLILLHGLGLSHNYHSRTRVDVYNLTGDTHIPFSKLSKSLKLPQTAVLALRAPEQSEPTHSPNLHILITNSISGYRSYTNKVINGLPPLTTLEK
jgi:hypothetical protein